MTSPAPAAMPSEEKTALTWTYDAAIHEDGAYVTSKLDGHAIATYGPIHPEDVTVFTQQLSAWTKDLALRLVAEATAAIRAQGE